jgi:23S rRNA (cytosine1962-C5)-methyltransferase
MQEYALLDSGNGEKLEKFGAVTLVRPAPQATWLPKKDKSVWDKADGHFSRKEGLVWKTQNVPESWSIDVDALKFKLSTSDFGHLGIFPEQKKQLMWLKECCEGKNLSVLNLFAHSGAATLACAKAKASVCHLDASKSMVAWARENVVLNHLENAPIRWIIDDAAKFMDREMRRESSYDGIILSPPSYGKGKQGEVFAIDTQLVPLLKKCTKLFSKNPAFLLLTCHTPGYTPQVLKNHLLTLFPEFESLIECGELFLEGGEKTLPLPSGAYARFSLRPIHALS